MTGSLRGDVTKEDAGNQNVLLTITWEFCPVDTFLSPVLQLVNTEGQDAIGQENDTRQQSVNVPERREEHSGPSCDLDNVVQDKGVHGKVFDDLLRLARWVLILLPWLGQGDIEEADEDDLTEGVCPDSLRGAVHPRAIPTETIFTTPHYYPKYEVWALEFFCGRIPLMKCDLELYPIPTSRQFLSTC